MIRPKDIYGNDIEMGPWYWARSRTGQIVGTGKFASLIGSDDVTWFINGTGYNPDNFSFVKAVDDPEQDFHYPQAGPRHKVEYPPHDWCANPSCRICARTLLSMTMDAP